MNTLVRVPQGLTHRVSQGKSKSNCCRDIDRAMNTLVRVSQGLIGSHRVSQGSLTGSLTGSH